MPSLVAAKEPDHVVIGIGAAWAAAREMLTGKWISDCDCPVETVDCGRLFCRKLAVGSVQSEAVDPLM